MNIIYNICRTFWLPSSSKPSFCLASFPSNASQYNVFLGCVVCPLNDQKHNLHPVYCTIPFPAGWVINVKCFYIFKKN